MGGNDNKVTGQNGIPNGYNRVRLYNPQNKKTEDYYIPIGKKIYFGTDELDPNKKKNKQQVVITGDWTKKDSNAFLIKTALDGLDVNNDRRIDKKDVNTDNLAQQLNGKALKSSKYYVKSNGVFSDAGIDGNFGHVTFSKNGEQWYDVSIDD